MKTLSNLINSFECNPGNKIERCVSNHLTPINNIITNVRNIFGPMLGIIVEPGEDGVSLKLHSSKFTSVKDVNRMLDNEILGNTTLRSYIYDQGLTDSKTINIGNYFIVYFGPNDIRTKTNVDAQNTTVDCTLPSACTEMLNFSPSEDCELNHLFEESFDDEELEDKTKEQLLKFINGTDKVKCAQKLSELLEDDLNLPPDYYFKGVKDSDGNESIALRYKFTKRRPFGKEVELSKSLLNIYKSGEEAVWVEAFLTKDKNSDEMNRIVDTVLKLIGATPTDDPCVYAIAPDAVQDLKDDVKDNKNDDNKDKDSDKNDDDLNKKENTEDISKNLKDSEKDLNN